MDSVIKADDTFPILAVFFALTWAALLLERTAVGKRVSAVMMVIIGAALLSNANVLPKSAPIYTVIWTYLVPLSIAIFLLKADLVSVLREGRRVLVAFLFGAVGVALGGALALAFLDFGTDGAAYAAVMVASYTGGSLNFAAVADAIGFQDETKLATAVAIDNVAGLGFIIFISFAAALPAFKRAYGWRQADINGGPAASGPAAGAPQPPNIVGFITALTLSAAACAVGMQAATAIGYPSYDILIITVLMVAIATVGRTSLSRIQGEDLIALVFMYLFFAMIGAGVDFAAVAGETAVKLLILILTMCAVHIVFVLIGGRLFRLNYAEMTTATLACIGGPAVALAIAVLFGWRQLAVPAIALGVFGYAVGTFIGIGLFTVVEMFT